MHTINSSQLEQHAIDVLERTAMVLVDPIQQAEAEALAPPTRFACLSYSGSAVGTLYLAASDGFLAELVSSMLGVEVDEVNLDVEGKDALNEMANIITGLLVLSLGSDNEPIGLGLPQCLESAHEPPKDAKVVEGIVETNGEILRLVWVPGDAGVNSAA